MTEKLPFDKFLFYEIILSLMQGQSNQSGSKYLTAFQEILFQNQKKFEVYNYLQVL